jgi:hypothetical protein
MKVKEFLKVLNKLIVKPRIFDLDLKVQIGNCCIDIDSIDMEDDMIVLNIFSDLPIFFFPVSPQDNAKTSLIVPNPIKTKRKRKAEHQIWATNK